MTLLVPYSLRFLTLALLCTLLLSSSPSEAAGQRRSVLVLHSYHKGLSWTDSITRGIEKRFLEEGVEVEFSYEYMDTKRFFSKQHYNNLNRLYRHKYQKTEFDVILSSDDNAYLYLLRYGKQLFGDTPIVFCGVNNFQAEDVATRDNITGVEEDFDFKATLEAALALQDNIEKIIVIGDKTTSGRANREKLMAILPDFSGTVEFEIIDDYSMAEVREYVNGLQNAAVFWLHFTADSTGRFFSFEDSTEMISQTSNVPLYSSWDFHMDHGIVGGMITNGVQQGYTAAGLALEIIRGKNAGEIPVISKSPNQYMFDYSQLKRYNIALNRLPEESIVINKPVSVVSEHMPFFLFLLAVFLILCTIILLLFFINIRRLRAERAANAAKDRYLGIFNDASVALLVEDFSALVEDLQEIERSVQGDFKKYLSRNRSYLVNICRKIVVKDANPAALELYDIAEKNMLVNILQRLVLTEKDDKLIDFIAALLQKERNYVTETVNRTLTGKKLNVILRVKLPQEYKDYDSVLVSVIDITDRKRAEEALAISEIRFRAAFNSAASGMALLSLDGRYQRVNRVLCSILGYEEAELLGKSWKDVTHPEDIERSRQMVERLFAGNISTSLEKRYLCKSGEIVWALFNGAIIYDNDGNPLHIIAQFQDISKRKEAEKKLLEQKERYQKFFEDDLAGVFIATAEGILDTCNQAFRTIYGLGKDIPPKDIDFFSFFRDNEDRRRFLDQLVQKERLEHYELHLQRSDGAELNVIINAIGRFGDAGELREIQGYVMDQTHQKTLEAQLLQAQKLESIGTMAGGVAHDFNNLLMGVLGNTSLLLQKKNKKHPDYNKLKNIEEYVKSGSSLTKQLLGFAKGGKYEVKTVNINEILHHNAGLFRQTHKEVEIVLELNSRSGMVDVDKSQIDQVMYNLYVNARQAMNDGGTIHVRTMDAVITPEESDTYAVSPGQYVRIEVEDNGSGMDADTLRRIFDPFFTTKEVGRGIGLGLASCYGIIQNHSGIITARSELGSGTCFSIHLPVSNSKTIATEERVEEKMAMELGKETIFLIDDEAMIIEVGTQMLEALGYEVFTATNGHEAVTVFQSQYHKIDLVILDMIMPGMSGGETFDALKDIDSNVRVILSSGYSFDNKARAIFERGCLGFLQKPFDLTALSKKTRHILDSSNLN